MARHRMTKWNSGVIKMGHGEGKQDRPVSDARKCEPIAMLPGEAGVWESEPIYPTVEQLPAPLRQRLEAVVGRKALR
jgi:hypothetical protein